MKILVADDDAVVVTALTGVLRRLGHDTVVARDGTEAWNLIQRDDAPSLLILDWMMPGYTGIELCRRLRRENKGRYQYVIMLTAKDGINDLLESVESGADDYLRKPFDKRELHGRLHAAERILTRMDELKTRADVDDLTGLLNHNAILSRLQKELALAERNHGDMSVLMCDLDNFKSINDAHGHQVGDEVLAEASKRMAGRLRPYDDLGRYGGEEFLGVLPGCASAPAREAAERIRDSISALPIRTTAGAIELTVSIGVATLHRTGSSDWQTLVSDADKALYVAKRGGRDRVELAQGLALPA